MNGVQVFHSDVLVIGAGLAGISSALSASAHGAHVTLLCDAGLCSGSSFSRATWGLGMVCESEGAQIRGPESLFKALCDVGMDMNTLELSETLVKDSPSSISFLQSIGAKVLEPRNPQEREFVACFDQKIRKWHGFVGNQSCDALRKALYDAGVSVIEGCQPLSLLQDSCGVYGVLAIAKVKRESLLTLHNLSYYINLYAPSVILATGGCGGLYEHHLCPSTSRGTGHALALEAGAVLTNMEFQQLMVGSLSPTAGIIFNEKLYRWSHFVDDAGTDAFARAGYDAMRAGQALEAHSWHGPFTTARESRLVEQVLDAAALSGEPCRVTYDQAVLGDGAPEFVKTYFSWLRDERGVDPQQPMYVGMFAHSSNGGIQIDVQARTSINGLFACGECAGGVHGADRIGGLASMAAVTFGRIAGESAAQYADSSPRDVDEGQRICKPLCGIDEYLARTIRDDIGRILGRSAMVVRSEEGLRSALFELDELQRRVGERATVIDVTAASGLDEGGFDRLFAGRDAKTRLLVARAIIVSCLGRRESRGPHYRIDYPELDPAYGRPSELRLADLQPN